MKKTPVFMSALVCPGLGQFMQGRKLAGTVLLVLILAACFSLLAFIFRIFAAFFRNGMNLGDPSDMLCNYIGISASLVCSLLIYIVGLADTISADKRPPPLPKTR